MTAQTLTPIGRIVQGNPLTGTQDTDDNNVPKWLDEAKTQPKLSWYVGLAISKQDPGWPALWALIHNEGRTGFPHLFAADGTCTSKVFSWKLIDGDGYDNKGKSYTERDGFAGHWILKLSSNYPMACFDPNNMRVENADVFYRGSYVQAAITVLGNGAKANTTPGVYVNVNGLRFVGHGERIQSGPDAATMFAGAAPTYIPAGMSATPLASSAPVPGLAPMGAAPQLAPPGMAAPAPQVAITPPPTAAPQMAAPAPAPAVAVPNQAFVAAALTAPGAPPAPLAPPAPAVAAVPTPVLTAAGQAQGFTIQQWLDAGHTIETLIGGGIVAYA